MPQRSNKYPGIQKQGDGTYLARAYCDRREYSKQFRTISEAVRWREKLLSDLRSAPSFVQFNRDLWSVEVQTPMGPVTYEADDLSSVIRWHDQTQAALVTGSWMSPQLLEMTVDDLIALWRTEKLNTSGKTMATYNSLLRRHIAALEDHSLIRLSPGEIQQWVQ
jgi:hypothetical protein